MGEEEKGEKELEEGIEKEVGAEVLEKLEEELKELAVPVATTPPEHTKLLDRLAAMDEKVEFVTGELAQRQGEKMGFAIGILYGLIIGILVYVMFLVG
ncbi:MAG: tetrahydromethanopterin S-methyltransferase subunit G [Methanophagales archaeon]|nr:tetrahydromethanopterin S-methyltransferase subunit G [Methanophagales archaeon]RLG32050.1 MAG: tetrahydromethanopterin S-methyltransferase subunit G [Methanosarcinales archaeon]